MVADRIIRDELLTSERYWSVSIEAQRLYVHLLLQADDTARFSGKNYTIRAACFPGQAVEPDKVEKLLAELADVDLVRLYEHEAERFLFVPRFKQRLRFKKSRYPSPPNGINDFALEKTDASQAQALLEPGISRQKRSEVKRSKPNPCASRLGVGGAFALFWQAYPRKKSKGAAEKAWLKIKPDEQLTERILSAVERATTSADWRREGGQFIPHPATWLNAKGWEDEMAQAASGKLALGA